MIPSPTPVLPAALSCLLLATASPVPGQDVGPGASVAVDGLIHTRNVVVGIAAECPHGTLKLEYVARPDVPAGRTRSPAPRVLHLSVNGESLPAAEIAKLDHLLGGRVVNNLWLSDCGYPGDPRFHGLISFNSLTVGELREEHVGFDVEDGTLSVENQRALGG